MCTAFAMHASSFLGLLGLKELGFLVCGIVKVILSIWTLRLFFGNCCIADIVRYTPYY